MAFGKSNNGLIGSFENVGLAGTLDQVVGAEGHQHWAFASQGGEGGWIIDKLKALDFAGGLVVEINSDAAALALANAAATLSKP